MHNCPLEFLICNADMLLPDNLNAISGSGNYWITLSEGSSRVTDWNVLRWWHRIYFSKIKLSLTAWFANTSWCVKLPVHEETKFSFLKFLQTHTIRLVLIWSCKLPKNSTLHYNVIVIITLWCFNDVEYYRSEQYFSYSGF